MTREELGKVLPPPGPIWREAYRGVFDKVGKRGELIHRKALTLLRDEWPTFSQTTIDMQYGGWDFHPRQPWTVLDYASLVTQDTRKSQLFGPKAPDRNRMYQQVGFEVNEYAQEADAKLRRGEPLSQLELAAHNLRNQAAYFFREYTVAGEAVALESLAAHVAKLEPDTLSRRATRHAAQRGATIAASQIIMHALGLANPIVGFGLGYGVGKLAKMTHGGLTGSPVDEWIFDKGSFANITPTPQPVIDALSQFISVYGRDVGKVEYAVKFDAQGKPVKTKKRKLEYNYADLLLLAESVYLHQSKWEFARGQFGHWSTAYLAIQRGKWANDPTEILQGVA